MPRRIAMSQLNASTIDILNVIRANANYEYQSLVPEVTDAHDIPKVGEVIYGHPSLANQFINALVNRIALVRVKSAIFNNAYAELKKGYLEFGETVEEVFVQIAKAREFSAEKAEQREHKRTLPDVRTAFHAINWRVQYPVTIQDEDLKQAFMSINGVQDLIAKIVDSVYTGAEYDEFLLFKYLIIKAVAHGKMYPVAVGGDDLADSAVAFRGTSNLIQFMSNEYNASGVTTTTPKADQYIFMDSMFNARYDVGVLASAFNMDKAEFQGKLKLIDRWDTFDNDRFDVIRANSDMIEPVTPEELAIMANVQAVLVDAEWFQVYDNHIKFTEKYLASGEYWNYFLNIKKTVSSSPFSNAIVFVTSGSTVEPLASYTVEVVDKSISERATILTLAVADDTAGLPSTEMRFVQDQTSTEKGIAVVPYGAVIFPAGQTTTTLTGTVENVGYTSAVAVTTDFEVGDTFAMNKNG